MTLKYIYINRLNWVDQITIMNVQCLTHTHAHSRTPKKKTVWPEKKEVKFPFGSSLHTQYNSSFIRHKWNTVNHANHHHEYFFFYSHEKFKLIFCWLFQFFIHNTEYTNENRKFKIQTQTHIHTRMMMYDHHPNEWTNEQSGEKKTV